MLNNLVADTINILHQAVDLNEDNCELFFNELDLTIPEPFLKEILSSSGSINISASIYSLKLLIDCYTLTGDIAKAKNTFHILKERIKHNAGSSIYNTMLSYLKEYE